MLDWLERSRDRVGLSLTAFPHGWRFVVASVWTLGFLFVTGFSVGLCEHVELVPYAELFTLLLSAAFMTSTIKRSYDFDAELMKLWNNQRPEKESVDDVEG